MRNILVFESLKDFERGREIKKTLNLGIYA